MRYKINKLFETKISKYMVVFDGNYKELFYLLSSPKLVLYTKT